MTDTNPEGPLIFRLREVGDTDAMKTVSNTADERT